MMERLVVGSIWDQDYKACHVVLDIRIHAWLFHGVCARNALSGSLLPAGDGGLSCNIESTLVSPAAAQVLNPTHCIQTRQISHWLIPRTVCRNQ
jgi:hypothetical protein